MKTWLRRIRAALVMGLIWAAVWAPVAVLIGAIVDPHDAMEEMWFAIGAYPGFLGGVLFSAVLGIAERRSTLEALPLPRVAGWGALAGLSIGVLPFVLGTPTDAVPRWLLFLIITGPITVLSGVSAAASLALARRAENRMLRDGTSVGAAPH